MASILPEDSGIIRCICEFDHDDNFTIQCERCNAWQHATCVNIKDENAVPEHYMCPECSDSTDKVDRERARDHQQRFLQRAEQLKHTRFQVEDHDEDRRRRGSRKRQSVPEIPKPVADPIPRFDHRFFVVPTLELDWTSEAAKVWADLGVLCDLPEIPPKELKSVVPLQVSRADTDWRLGTRAGAVSPTVNVGANRPVCELFGEVMLRSEYSREPTNQFSRLGCPKPGVVFVPGLPFALDMRRHGSREALFLRRSSTPNARLVATKDAENRLRVYVYTRKPVKAGVELSLGWHWPLDHPIRKAMSNSDLSATVDDKHTSEFVRTALWLLEVSLPACLPCETKANEVDEDWIITDTKPPPPPRPRKRAEELGVPKALDEADPGMAVAMHVWVPAAVSVAPPPKKRMSLKDYMRKRA